MDEQKEKGIILVARKACFGLPTACPSCLPVYLYLRFANISFDMHFDTTNPVSDAIPYVEYDEYVAFNNEKGGVIETLKDDGIVDLDSKLANNSVPDWLSTKAIITSWLADATIYELWVNSDGNVANQIYFSDLPWPIGKILHWKQTRAVKQMLGITNINTEEREAEIYKKASLAYEALSMKLSDNHFLFDNRPTSLDVLFLGHVLFVLQASNETSLLRSKILMHDNLVWYAENLKKEFLEAGSSSSFVPSSPSDPSTSSTPRKGPFSQGSKPKTKPNRGKTEEEKSFRRRAKYFLATQLVAVLVFLSLMGGFGDAEVELEDDEDGLGYED
ncbi:mitochondrial outer membrane import complex protein METAXIN-like [Aristolochia californica]|uniref:mitochondrial outer membrane import complex protein METAXIN-like n=1 Tax=Aristolochia californica TaxID=171875 RepID=UPI0035DA4D58